MLSGVNKWILKLASGPYGAIALFALSVCEAIFFPLLPDFMLIPLALALPAKAYKFAIISTIGSVIGATVGYLAGNLLWLNPDKSFTETAMLFFNNVPGFTVSTYNEIQTLYEKWNFLVIFIAGFAPLPYKIFTITAGVFNVNFFLFISAALLSRGLRFVIIAWLIRKFGEPVKVFIERRMKLISISILIVIIIVFIFVKFF